jgi:hypothetical protein
MIFILRFLVIIKLNMDVLNMGLVCWSLDVVLLGLIPTVITATKLNLKNYLRKSVQIWKFVVMVYC